MCETWESIDSIVTRLVNELAARPAATSGLCIGPLIRRETLSPPSGRDRSTELNGEAVGPKGGDRPTAAQPRASSASIGRAHIGREGRANVIEFVHRKGPAARGDPGQVWGGGVQITHARPRDVGVRGTACIAK